MIIKRQESTFFIVEIPLSSELQIILTLQNITSCRLMMKFHFSTWLARVIFLIGSLRSDDGDGNKNSKKSNRFRLAKPQFCTCITLFCTFLCRRCTTTCENAQFHVLLEDGNTRQQLSFSFPDLWYSPLESTPKKFTSIWRIKRGRISVIKFKAAGIHFLSDVLVAVPVVGS